MSTTETERDLAGWLRGLPDADLGQLLRERPDLLHPVPSDVAVLASRASGRVSVELALDRLDLGALQVVEAMALLPEPASTSALAELLEVAPSRLARAITHLRANALVWGTDDALRLATAVRELLPFPAGLGPPARSALAEIPPARLPGLLADLASLLGHPIADLPEQPSAAEALDAIAGLFEDHDRLANLLAAVPPKPREVIDLLAAGSPVGRTGAARRPVDATTADTPLRWLLAHGLLVAVDDYTVVLPREIGLLVRGGRPLPDLLLDLPPLDAATHAPSDVDATAAGQAFTTVRLVESLLEKWGVDPPGVLRAGGLGVRELRRAARELDVDERHAALLIEVAHASGLLAPDGETGESWLPTAGPGGYDAWLMQPTATRWCLLARAWVSTTRVPGLVGRRDSLDSVGRPAPAPNALGPDVDRALAPIVRSDLLKLLDTVDPGTAPACDALVAALRWTSPRRGGQLRDDLCAWSHEEAELLGITGRGALSSFGRLLVTGVADESDETTDPIQPAADALQVLLPEPVDHVLLQADLTAIAPGPLESELSRELGLLADVESTGGATVYRFSPTSVRRALDAGRSASDVHALLAARSRTPVPQPLTYLIDDVARRHGRMRVGAAGSYVRCDDETVLAEALADRRLDSLRLHRLAPTVIVSPLAPERVAERLREVGYAPAAEGPGGALLLRRPDSRRAPSRPHRPQRRAELTAPPPTLLAAAVRAIRAGDKAAAAARNRLVGLAAGDSEGNGSVPRSPAGDSVVALREAVATGRPLWIGYLNAQGQASSRIIEPLRLAGGYVTAFDHRRDEVRTFAVHRITGVAWLDDTDGGIDAGTDANRD